MVRMELPGHRKLARSKGDVLGAVREDMAVVEVMEEDADKN